MFFTLFYFIICVILITPCPSIVCLFLVNDEEAIYIEEFPSKLLDQLESKEPDTIADCISLCMHVKPVSWSVNWLVGLSLV